MGEQRKWGGCNKCPLEVSGQMQARDKGRAEACQASLMEGKGLAS